MQPFPTFSSLLALGFVIVFVSLLIVMTFVAARRERPGMRTIMAFDRLRRAIGLGVESGTRLHISLGRGNLAEPEAAAGFAGLAILERSTQAASVSDRPPVATSGDGSISILSRDTMQATYAAAGAEGRFTPASGRLTGLTPFSYVAGAMAVNADENVSANIIVGHIGSEAALLVESAEQNHAVSIGGSDDPNGLAVLYAAAHEPLVGEEMFVGGAYLGAKPVDIASIQVQDWLRWVLIAFILVGGAARLLNINW
jgi:hypothetical protein